MPAEDQDTNAGFASNKSKPLENEGAIPVAGGERLGEKHWGESKIVPDNPKPLDGEQGIASADGQPDDATKANTEKNAGHEGDGKESLMDKIKDKLPGGAQKKE